MSDPVAIPSPAALMQFLDKAAGELDELGKRLESAHIALGDAEAVWEQDKDTALLELIEQYEAEGKRLPGEDVRLAKARKRIGFQTYSDFIKAQHLVKAIERRVKRLETAVNARQSTLKALREGGGEEWRQSFQRAA